MKIFPPSKNPPTVRRRVSLFDSFVRGDSVQNVFVRERFAGLSVLVDVVLQCRFLSGQEKTEVDVNFRVDAKLVAQNFLDVTEIAEPRHLCAERRILINRVAKSAVFRIGAARNAFELFVVEDSSASQKFFLRLIRSPFGFVTTYRATLKLSAN